MLSDIQGRKGNTDNQYFQFRNVFMCVDPWQSNRGAGGPRARTGSRNRWLGPSMMKPEEAHGCWDQWHYCCTFEEGCQDNCSWEQLRGDNMAFDSHQCLGPCSVLPDEASCCHITPAWIKWLPATTSMVTRGWMAGAGMDTAPAPLNRLNNNLKSTEDLLNKHAK